MRTHRLTGLLLLALLAACNRSSTPTGVNPGGAHYDADITRTALGIPHIKANDFGGMGYGYGYAFAEDNLCVLAEDLLTIRGERAKYFGRDGSYTIVPNGVTAKNVPSDYFWKFVATDEVVNNLRAKALPELRAATSGFVAGYNRYLRELKAGQHPGRFTQSSDPNDSNLACAGAPWLSEITDADMYRRYYRLALIASSSALINPIVEAQPPTGVAAKGKPLSATQVARLLKSTPTALSALGSHAAFASNMYAFGKGATTTGMPMLWGNPHFPWTGTERLYISHLTIPGKMDVMGSSLYGVPAVLIGFTDNFAWSHTVSTAYRFTIYELTLDPSNPTKYLYDGASRAMTAVPITIDILENGKITHETKTLYRSHYGPMLAINANGVPVLGWTNAKAYTLRDANAENDRLINQFALWDQAKSLTEFKALHKSILGVPWVNTVATGPGEKAYYGDVTVVPNVPDSKNQICASALEPAIQQLNPGLPLLDGSRSACEWDTDADAPAPGIFGPSHLPVIERDDYVHNCNDSYWLTNPAQPLTGFARIIGDENTARTLRTRLCILQAQRRLAGTDGRPGNKMDLATLEDIGLSSQIYSAELARASVISSLCALPMVPSSSGPVDPSAACAALKNWNGADNLTSTGGHIWREFWRTVSGGPLPVQLAALNNSYWVTPFSGNDPVNTPNTLNVALPSVQAAFGDAINTVAKSGFAFDAAMGSLQHPCCIDKSIPIFGGEDFEGAFTVVDGTNVLDKTGYNVPYGNSYIQAVTWDAKGAVAEGFITYSQSTDPANPHFSDYTKEYSAKRWHRFPYHEDEVRAAEVSRIRISE
jgi:acyl-homoserine-lactone acylase